MGRGKIHTRAREIPGRRDAKGMQKMRGASRLPGISRARVCIFAHPTIAIAKIRDYSQCIGCFVLHVLIGSLLFYRLLRLASCDYLNYNRPYKGGGNNCYIRGKRLPFFAFSSFPPFPPFFSSFDFESRVKFHCCNKCSACLETGKH